MIRRETEIVKEEVIKYKFFCDLCGEHIGTSEEGYDGWYYRYGDYKLSFKLPSLCKTILIEKTLCGKCAFEFEKKIFEDLEKFTGDINGTI